MTSEPTTAPTRWAGVPGPERVRERRALLVQAAFELLGDGGEAATSLRAVCRAASLNARYFYESFDDLDQLLGATYDREATDLGVRLGTAMAAADDSAEARARAGIDTVLRHITEDPRRARILFTEAATNPVLVERRRTALRALVDAIAEQGRTELGDDRPGSVADVAAALFGGAMLELTSAWLEGRLGTDLDRVVDDAVALSLALFAAARDR